MAQNTFPSDWRDQPCFLVSVPAALVPYVAGLLKIAEKRGFWASDSDYAAAYAALMEMESAMASNCIDVLLERQDAVYRLLNTALFGQLYNTVSTEPLVVEPAIEPHVNLDVHNQDSVMGRLDRLTQLVDNAINGTETPLYDLSPSVKALLQQIVDASTADDTDISAILEAAQAIALLVA